MCPGDDTFSTSWSYFEKLLNLQLALTEVSTGGLTSFLQSKVSHTETLSEASSDV